MVSQKMFQVSSTQQKKRCVDACSRYESAAGVCDGNGPGGPAVAMIHWEKAAVSNCDASFIV